MTKRSGSSESTITTGTSDSSESSLDTNLINLMLDPHLRPIPPDPTSQRSQQIYQEHCQTADKYLQV